MLCRRPLLSPLPIGTKPISVLGGSTTGRIIKPLLFALPLLVLPHLVIAQESSSWIGQKVVTRYYYPVKIGDQVVEKQNLFHVYAVKQTNGDWLWVVSGSIEGWLPASQALRFDQAIDFYTQEIAANPGNSSAWFFRGVIWREKKDYDRAINDYNEGIRLNPTFAAAYNSRGVVWSTRRNTTRQ